MGRAPQVQNHPPAALAALSLSSCNKYDESAILSDISDIKSRLSALEEQMSAANGNVSTLQGLVSALQGNVYVTSVTPIVKCNALNTKVLQEIVPAKTPG